MDNLETLTTLVTQDTGNQEWTSRDISHKTQGQSRMDNLTDNIGQDTGAIKNGQSRDTDNIGHTRHRSNQ